MSAGYRWLERPLARWTDRIVAHSRSIEQFLVERLGIPAQRVAVIANGVDARQSAADRRRDTGGSDRPRAGGRPAHRPHAARISPQKNHDVVVGALAHLKAAGTLPPSFRLLLAGRVSSAHARQISAAVRRHGLDAQIRFLGAVTDMRELYAAADVVLMPSRTEASPIAALEALSWAPRPHLRGREHRRRPDSWPSRLAGRLTDDPDGRGRHRRDSRSTRPQRVEMGPPAARTSSTGLPAIAYGRLRRAVRRRYAQWASMTQLALGIGPRATLTTPWLKAGCGCSPVVL